MKFAMGEAEGWAGGQSVRVRRHGRAWWSKRTGAGLLAAVTMSLLFSACSSSAATTKPRSTSKVYTVGVAVPDTTDSYFVAIYTGFEKEAAKLGMKTTVVNASGSVRRQVDQVETLGAGHPSAVVIDTINTRSIAPAIKAVNNDHVPVFTVDNAPSKGPLERVHGHVVSVIQSNNLECGLNEGKELINYLHGRSADVGRMILEPVPEDTHLRHQGFDEAIAKDPKIRIVDTTGGPISFSGAVHDVSAMLEGHPNVNVVYSDVGPNTQGAADAVVALHKVGKVVVVGNTTETGPIKYVEQGIIVGGATQLPYKEGVDMAERVYEYLTGKDKNPPKVTFLPCSPVTKSNAAAALTYAKSVGLTG